MPQKMLHWCDIFTTFPEFKECKCAPIKLHGYTIKKRIEHLSKCNSVTQKAFLPAEIHTMQTKETSVGWTRKCIFLQLKTYVYYYANFNSKKHIMPFFINSTWFSDYNIAALAGQNITELQYNPLLLNHKFTVFSFLSNWS